MTRRRINPIGIFKTSFSKTIGAIENELLKEGIHTNNILATLVEGKSIIFVYRKDKTIESKK